MPEVLSSASLQEILSAELQELKNKDLLRRLRALPKGLIDFSSNDYLGLRQNSWICKKTAQAVLCDGAGSGASRLISGNLKIHSQLEKELAQFKKEEAALVFSSGYLANLGVITSLVDERDVVILDRLNHASLVDGARLSRAKLWVYPHRDVDALRMLLKRGKNFRRRLVVTDAYFSMDGDVAPLDKILAVCEETDSILMIDEAHSTGVFGTGGHGLTEHFGLEGKIPVVMGTLSKALASSGGFVAGSQILKELLVNRARSLIYTTAPVPAASAAAMASLEWIEKNPAVLKKFWQTIQGFRASLEEAGFDLMGSEGPILPVLIGEASKALKFRDLLEAEGFFVPAVRPPTVPKNTDRLRISLKTTHTKGQIDSLVRVLVKARNKIQ